jgi:hypothetical protein
MVHSGGCMGQQWTLTKAWCNNGGTVEHGATVEPKHGAIVGLSKVQQ